MSRSRLVSVLAFVVAAAPAGVRIADAHDPHAVEVAKRTLAAMGGEAAFARLRTLRFDFVVERGGKEVARRGHLWDRHDGRYRASWKTEDGKTVVALFDVNDPKKGRAWLDGKAASGEELGKLLEDGYGLFINDTYWLLMPAKMLDPGVHLAYEGEKNETGRLYDVVHVSFDGGVGLTPKDNYWAYVSKESGLMERWDFVLQDRKPEDRRTFLWQDWRPIGGVRLSLRKSIPDGSAAIRFENMSGSEARETEAFDAPPGP